jgi:hypothetical protein
MPEDGHVLSSDYPEQEIARSRDDIKRLYHSRSAGLLALDPPRKPSGGNSFERA